MASSRSSVLKLYKTMLKEAREFTNYNFREYALRRIRGSFRENKKVVDEIARERMIKNAKENLELIKRQTTVGKLYSAGPLVIEKSTEARFKKEKLACAPIAMRSPKAKGKK